MFFTTLFWGISFIWTKKVLEYYSPITIVFLRLVISSFILLSTGIIFKKIKKVKRSDIKHFMLFAFFQPFLYFLGESTGLTFIPATMAAVIVETIPVFSLVIAFFVFGEKLTKLNIAGVFISLFGVILVLIKDDLSLRGNPIGLLMMLLAVISAVIYSLLIIKLTKKYDAYTITTWQNIIGMFYFLPLFLLFDLKEFLSTKLSVDAILPLCELSVFASSIAFILFTYGVKNLGVTKANVFTNFVPVFTAIFAFFLTGELLSEINILGIAIVLTGISMSQIRYKPFK